MCKIVKIVVGRIGSRTTRLGVFLPIGRLFSLGSFFNTEVAQILGLFLPRYKLCINYNKIQGLAHFRRFFLKLILSPCGS
jgi:hypothetical protein